MDKYLTFTPSLFFEFEKNPLGIWHDIYGDITKKEPLSEFISKIMEGGKLHEKKYISTLQVTEVKEMAAVTGVGETLNLMRAGETLIYQGWLETRVGDNCLSRATRSFRKTARELRFWRLGLCSRRCKVVF